MIAIKSLASIAILSIVGAAIAMCVDSIQTFEVLAVVAGLSFTSMVVVMIWGM
jgi:hypothetical protein